MAADGVHDTLNRSVIRWIQLLQYAHQIVFRKSKSLAFQMRNGLGRQRTTKQLHIIRFRVVFASDVFFLFTLVSGKGHRPAQYWASNVFGEMIHSPQPISLKSTVNFLRWQSERPASSGTSSRASLTCCYIYRKKERKWNRSIIKRKKIFFKKDRAICDFTTGLFLLYAVDGQMDVKKKEKGLKAEKIECEMLFKKIKPPKKCVMMRVVRFRQKAL